MSVLIKGMEMPKHCGYCRFRYDGICHALQKTEYAVTDCPLVEVPTPHGRLIDGDYLYERFKANGCPDDNVYRFIQEEPTVIEAEE